MLVVNSIVTYTKVALQMDHFVVDKGRVQHGNGSILEGVAGTSVQITSTRADTKSVSRVIFVNQLWLTYAEMYSK